LQGKTNTALLMKFWACPPFHMKLKKGWKNLSLHIVVISFFI
jgi:hypothetical protein